MRFIIFLVFILTNSAFASENSIEQQMNQQIWQPFKQSTEAADAQAFNKLHTDDIIRSWPGEIQIGKVYKEVNQRKFSNPKLPDVTLNFAFEDRTHAEDLAYEVGYYEVIIRRKGKPTKTNYGRFHVVLKKIEGRWLIAQDRDTTHVNGEPVTKVHFDRATRLNLN